MRRDNAARFLKKYEWLIVTALFVLGIALRTVWLGTLPLGLNQDEASTGYEAWSLLNYGIDRNGDSWPVIFTSWGSGQNVLYSWLLIPFVAVFGLNVLSLRLVAVLAGYAMLFVFWLLARSIRGRGFAAAALLILVVNPWHIMASRWALESNLLPLFLLLGIYFTTRAKEKPKSLIWAAVFFGLSLYAYGTAFFFLPLFLIAAIVWLRKILHLRIFILSFLLFAAIALPITICQVINLGSGDGIEILGITFPKLTESRYMSNSVFGGGGWAAAKKNFSSFINILVRQTDSLPFNAMDQWGLYYFFGLCLAAGGFIAGLATHRDHPKERPLIIGLFVCFIVAFFIDPNINRMNMAFLFILYFSSLGLYYLLCKLSYYALIPAAGVLLCCALFFNSYYTEFKAQGSDFYYPGLGEAIEYVESAGAESVYISNYVNQPYIFVLFYTHPTPYEFIKTVDYLNPDGQFRYVSSFGKYRFGNEENAEGTYIILHKSESAGFPVIAGFGNFVVCEGSM